jgi:hypothetical protein
MHGIPPPLQRRLDRVEAEARSALAEAPDKVERLIRLGAAMSVDTAADLTLHDIDAVFRDPLDTPLAVSLRRRAPAGCRTAGEQAGTPAETALDQALGQLAAGAGSVPDVHRVLHGGELLLLADPFDEHVTDILCFCVRPDRYRGIVVPAFSGWTALSEARRHRPEWATKTVLRVPFDQLRSALITGETIVINPWLPTEYRFSTAEQGYQPESPVPTSAVTTAV